MAAKIILFVVAFYAFCHFFATASKILVVFPVPARSHYILGNKVARALAARGHEVTLIGSFQDEKLPKNVRQLYLDGLTIHNEEADKDMFKIMTSLSNPVFMMYFMGVMGVNMTEGALSHPKMQRFLKDPNESFDAVITEEFVNHPFKALSYHFNAPQIAFSTVGAVSWVNNLVGNPAPTSYIPDVMYQVRQHRMNFWQRLTNGLISWLSFFHDYYLFFVTNQQTQKHFPGVPHIYDIAHNVSLVLLNSHISTNAPVPLLPNMIDVGGYHVDPPKKLPDSLEKYLNNSKNGVIYFSMGSNLKSKFLPDNIREALLKTFAKLKYDVLWKFEADDLPGKPPNVRIEKWLPQQDILAHPKVILFITHGGLLSTIETIYHGKPVIGIPVFGDQQWNMANAVANGFAVQLDLFGLTEQSLTSALNEILDNPKYTENAKLRSKLMHDRLVSPRDTLGYWVEYVIRHKNGKHFRSAALDLSWYQLYSLDIFVFVLFVISAIIYLVRNVFKFIFGKRNVIKTKND